MFDTTINLGHVLTALAMLIAGSGAWYSLKFEMKSLREKVDNMGDLLTKVALQDQRISFVEKIVGEVKVVVETMKGASRSKPRSR